MRRLTVKQYLLSTEGSTDLLLAPGAKPLDVHLIDGIYHLRVLEDVESSKSEGHPVVVIPMAVGSAIEVRDDAEVMPLRVRHGGIHFIMVEMVEAD